MRRKIFMGALALALPLGTLAATQSTAFAGGTSNPTTCSGFSGQIVFGGGMGGVTVDGAALTTMKKGSPYPDTTVTTGNLTCTAGTGSSPTLTISPTGKNTQVQKKPTKEYVIGTWSEFTSGSGSIKKALKSIAFTINGSTNTWKTKGGGLTFTGCPGEIGESLTGQVKGTYATKTATILVCLGQTTRVDGSHGQFLTDYNSYNGNPAGNGTPGSATGGVVSVSFDPLNSTATL